MPNCMGLQGCILAGCLALSILGCTSQSSPSDHAPSRDFTFHEWRPDAALLSKLAEPTEIAKGLIVKPFVRPPKGYVLTPQPPSPGVQVLAWIGPRRSDQTAPQFLITLIETPPGKELPNSLTVADQLLDTLRRRREGFTNTYAEQGGNGTGQGFWRVYWSGKDPNLGKQMHGFCYVTHFMLTHTVEISSQECRALSRGFAAAGRSGGLDVHTEVTEVVIAAADASSMCRCPHALIRRQPVARDADIAARIELILSGFRGGGLGLRRSGADKKRTL